MQNAASGRIADAVPCIWLASGAEVPVLNAERDSPAVAVTIALCVRFMRRSEQVGVAATDVLAPTPGRWQRAFVHLTVIGAFDRELQLVAW
jgi:hypothetical protein